MRKFSAIDLIGTVLLYYDDVKHFQYDLILAIFRRFISSKNFEKKIVVAELFLLRCEI
ncbi:hypothetical protein BVRB_6g150060 [Beta vulgaris subsp. vulgaris]|nr:hypothetical protein BVRB_6g150060 [Beta vulgaris subsp. vulgaris]